MSNLELNVFVSDTLRLYSIIVDDNSTLGRFTLSLAKGLNTLAANIVDIFMVPPGKILMNSECPRVLLEDLSRYQPSDFVRLSPDNLVMEQPSFDDVHLVVRIAFVHRMINILRLDTRALYVREHVDCNSIVDDLLPQGFGFRNDMIFYKPPFAIVDDPETVMLEAIDSIDRTSLTVLSNYAPLRKIYPWHISPEKVLFFLYDPQSAEETGSDANTQGNIISQVNRRFNYAVEKMIQGRSDMSRIPEELICNGRYRPSHMKTDPRALDIRLYNPCFAQFLDDIVDDGLQAPASVMQATTRLMVHSPEIYSGTYERRAATLRDFEIATSTTTVEAMHLDKTKGEGLVLASSGPEAVITGIISVQNVFGDECRYRASQDGVSDYIRFWAQKARTRIRGDSCCPTFLLSIRGPWFAVLGAVLTDKILVQPLTDYIWLGNSTVSNEPSINRIAHVLHSLGRNMKRLEDYYRSLKTQPRVANRLHPRFFPSIDAYRAPDNTIVKFVFIRPLERDSICATFLAETEGPSPKYVVVKFVSRYNADAHRVLAAAGMAPVLLYFGKVGVREGDPSYGHLRMVVMDYIDGLTADHVKSLPDTFHARVRAIVTQLHDNGYVFGDLRAPNIMLTTDGKVLFIDFDWVGTDGESTYPFMMSESIQWPKGVGNGLGALMKKEHDFEMLDRLFKNIAVGQ